ncbi:hypothetical protein ES703_86212 [subsurface metagenome]
MIRFIDLGNQILLLEGHKKFAWFDTVTDTFEAYNRNQTWDNWEDFAEDYLVDEGKGITYESRPLNRYKGLFPSVWP